VHVLEIMTFVDPCTIVKFIKKNLTRCNNISKFYYSIFIWSSTCFGRHTAHDQEPKTALAASDFSYLEGCWTCSWWMLSGTVLCLTTSTNFTPNNLLRMQNQRLPVQFRLLMMGSVSPETCWASYKYGIIKFWYIVASCLIFLYEFLRSVLHPTNTIRDIIRITYINCYMFRRDSIFRELLQQRCTSQSANMHFFHSRNHN
jgi:hypothetical protein